MTQQRGKLLRTLAAGGVLLALSASCGDEERTPVGAVRAFYQAVSLDREQRAFELLAPPTQQRLLQMAQTATSQTGGSRHFQPSELLTTNLTPPRQELGKVEEVRRDEQKAVVRVSSSKNEASEEWELVKVDGRWRIALALEKILAKPAD